ncbi:MAG: lytic transglycosylase domain-containing protein [Myxococcota bacterium]
MSDALGFAQEVMGDAIIEGYEDFVDDDPSEALSILLSRDRSSSPPRSGTRRVPRRPTAFDRLGRVRLSYADLAPHIDEAVVATGLPAALIDAVIRTESGYRPHAVSRVGAKGLMQLMPGTAREMGVGDAFDPRQNILGGARYLRRMYDRFGSLELAIAAYNAGPAKVARYRGIPPFKETRRYVGVVMDRYQRSPLR